MKEIKNKGLESLIGTITKAELAYWVKNAVVLSEGITPLVKALVPLIMLSIVLKFLQNLLGF